MPRPYKAALFDLDGTLCDSMGLILRSYHHTMKTHLGEELPDELWLKGVGIPLNTQLAEFARSPNEIPAMRQTYAEYYIAHHDSEITMFPGAIEAVDTLKTMGILVGLVTSKSRVGVNRTLQLHELTRFFDVVVSASDVQHGKPHPEPVLLALSQLGMEAQNACFVGDSTHDLAAGNAAGVDSIAVAWGPYPKEDLEQYSPTTWLTTPDDIVSLGSSQLSPSEGESD